MMSDYQQKEKSLTVLGPARRYCSGRWHVSDQEVFFAFWLGTGEAPPGIHWGHTLWCFETLNQLIRVFAIV
jgi:hypothetical protein